MADFEKVVSAEGDMVDLIAFERFGTSSGSTEAIYAANPGLAAFGPILPAGVTILVPVPGERPRTTAERLWD